MKRKVHVPVAWAPRVLDARRRSEPAGVAPFIVAGQGTCLWPAWSGYVHGTLPEAADMWGVSRMCRFHREEDER